MKLGECGDGNDGAIKTITAGGKDFEFKCVDDGWESEAFDKFIEEAESGAIKDVIDGEGCKFKIDDKVWKYSYSAEQMGVKAEYTFTIDTQKGVRSQVIKATGSSAELACKYGEFENDATYCKYGAMYETHESEVEVTPENRDRLFGEFMQDCQYANGNVDFEYDFADEKDDPTDDPADKSSSSNVSDGPESSSSVDEDFDYGIDASCDFKKSDDKWVVDMDGVSLVYEWSGSSYTAYTLLEEDMGDSETCEYLVSTYKQIGMDASCNGSVFVSKSKVDAKEDADRDAEYKKIAGSYCKS